MYMQNITLILVSTCMQVCNITLYWCLHVCLMYMYNITLHWCLRLCICIILLLYQCIHVCRCIILLLYWCLHVCRCIILLYTGVYIYVDAEYYSILVSMCMYMQNSTLYWCLRVCRILLSMYVYADILLCTVYTFKTNMTKEKKRKFINLHYFIQDFTSVSINLNIHQSPAGLSS